MSHRTNLRFPQPQNENPWNLGPHDRGRSRTSWYFSSTGFGSSSSFTLANHAFPCCFVLIILNQSSDFQELKISSPPCVEISDAIAMTHLRQLPSPFAQGHLCTLWLPRTPLPHQQRLSTLCHASFQPPSRPIRNEWPRS